MKNFKYSVLLVMVIVLALFFAGCAKPPEAEQQAAKKALEMLQSSDAIPTGKTEKAAP